LQSRAGGGRTGTASASRRRAADRRKQRSRTRTSAGPDRSLIVIPNRKIVGEVLHNYGKVRQVSFEVGVSYDTDLGAALKVTEEVLRATARVLKDPAPVVGVAKLADSAVVIRAAPWVRAADFGPAGGELQQALVEEFRRRSIAIPAPQREIRMVGSSTAYVGRKQDAA
jgi:small conductance mechanosensitive channel